MYCISCICCSSAHLRVYSCHAGILAIIRDGEYKEASIFTGTPGTGKSTAAVVIACDVARRGLHFMHRSSDALVGETLVYMDFRSPGEAIVDYAHERQGVHYERLKGVCGFWLLHQVSHRVPEMSSASTWHAQCLEQCHMHSSSTCC